MPKKILLWFTALCIIVSSVSFAAAEETGEILFGDNFESYGVDGSGKDETGKAVNPVKPREDGSSWFNSDAASKRGVIIFTEENSDNHYMCLYKQNNVQKTEIAARLGQSSFDGDCRYTIGMRVYLPQAYGYYASAGCNYKISAKSSADESTGIDIADLSVSHDFAQLSLGGRDTEKNLGMQKWYNIKLEILLSGGKSYVNTYVNGDICAEAAQLEYTADEIKNMLNYISISADLTGILDARGKAVLWLDDISLSADELGELPLTASYDPPAGSRVSNPKAPLNVSFSGEIQPVGFDDVSVSGGAVIEDIAMNDENTGFSVRFSGLTEGRTYTVNILACRPGGEKQEYSYEFTYTGNKEVYVSDWFDTYGVDGSGIDESGKTVNPISAYEEYGKWYNKEAASKRGAIIMQNDDKTPELNFFLQSQNKVTRTQMSSLLKNGAEALGTPNGVYEFNAAFTVPYGTGTIKSVGLRDSCYAKAGLTADDGTETEFFKIDYDSGKNRISFFGSDKTAPINENLGYNVKMIIYPQNGQYTADLYLGNENGENTQLMNREPINIEKLSKMNRLAVDVKGYDSTGTVRLFVLKGIEFRCCYTPKLVACDANMQKLALKNNVITAEFDTMPPQDISAYGIDNGAVIAAAERIDDYTIRLEAGGLKNGESYTLSFEGVKNDDGYGCLDTAVFEVERKIEVKDISLDGNTVKNGENKVTVQLGNTTDESLGASLIVLVCTEADNGYRIEQVVVESRENISADDTVTAVFTADTAKKNFAKVFLLDSADGMHLLYDEVIYR